MYYKKSYIKNIIPIPPNKQKNTQNVSYAKQTKNPITANNPLTDPSIISGDDKKGRII